MRWLILYTAMFLGANAACAGEIDWQAAHDGGLAKLQPTDPSPVPETGFTDPQGGTHSLADWRGKVVLLNFWATWCGPCREELSRVQKDIIDRFKGNEDFVFLPVSRGETRETVAAFREKMGYTFPMGLDPEQKIYRLYASNYIPRNFLIGKDGKVISATIGYEAPEFDELILLIERQLNSAN